MSTNERPRLIRPEPRPMIQKIPVYSRAEGLETVKWVASSNESPLPPAPSVIEAMTRSVEQVNRYPTMFGDTLTAALAVRFRVRVDQVAVGAGSLSILQQALTAFTGPSTEVVYAWRSYEAYPIAVRIAGATAIEIPLTANFEHDLSAMAEAITPQTRAVIVCNPNNPTGTALPMNEIMDFLRLVPRRVLVILDEAYREFLGPGDDGLNVLSEFSNLLVMRTFSKAYGLAGVRAGYALGQSWLIENIRRASPPFGLSLTAESAALAALEDTSHTRHIIRTITRDRDAFTDELRMRGLRIPESSGNFVWIPTTQHSERLVAVCLKQGVSVRAFRGEGVRVTVGDCDATAAVLKAIDVLLPELLVEQQF